MRKTVWTYGLVAGAVAILAMLAAVPFINTVDFRKADVLGYASIVLSALLVFFGVRSYREKAGEGRLTLGRGFAVGVLITLISCACYVLAFEVLYFKLVPDFGDRFSACMVERARASGANQQEIDTAAKRARMLKQWYDDPLTNAAVTFSTSFPIGLAVSAISAAILRKR